MVHVAFMKNFYLTESKEVMTFRHISTYLVQKRLIPTF